MLEDIRINQTATYHGPPQVMTGLRPVNFIFGTNGSGKTTISRVIADPAAHPSCEVAWKKDRPLLTLVYNSDFTTRNYGARLRGVFTLGDTSAKAIAEVETARKAVEDLQGEITTLAGVLGRDDTVGRRAERAMLRTRFETECWEIKAEHDAHFAGAFEGIRTSKAKFCDRVLVEAARSTTPLYSVDELKTRATVVFGDIAAPMTSLITPDENGLLELETDPILAKKVVGKEDIDVAGLIKRLGNSDWVRQGLAYAQSEAPCPFCQKPLDDALHSQLTEFFDEAYDADIAAIARVEAAYQDRSTRLLASAQTALDTPCTYVDRNALAALVDRLAAHIALNLRHLERKRKEPSTPVALDPIAEAYTAVRAAVDTANVQIARHNALIANIKTERATLTNEIWRRLIEDRKASILAYSTAKGRHDAAIESMGKALEGKQDKLSQAMSVLAALEKGVTSVKPTVTAINATLTSFGFTSFKLNTAGDKEEFYEIVRGDGTDARDTLSEGERCFVTFLYFYHLVQGATTASGVTTDRIVVIDDPVSSLDSDVLFIVSALIKRLLAEATDGKGRIKQVFVLTHNIYFHKEVTFDTKRSQRDALKSETFWTVRKVGDLSTLQRHETNPIRTGYELLWEEVRDPSRSLLTIQNVLRRILEHYFTILGGVDRDDIVGKFQGKDQMICGSLFSWINDGSHNFADDLYVAADSATVDRYLAVFKAIFYRSEHGAHYRMMMKLPPDTAEQDAHHASEQTEAVELMAEAGLPAADGHEPDMPPAPAL
ncbi:AAA family ATPase [Brevundimonas diminuta]|uniref:AAA family ATPase n=1 Tax=Brevundimonas diminuta TaxID=293 RepID=A0A7T4KW92_BREDI|nr:AAA family ATPase [Brevundimonas diminuta]QQB88867.1 AAA family ATPase [Brevundimonas diminuta]